jgi:tetratricopeptide (TPR) repeat protein
LARWIATRAEEVGAARRLEAFNTPDAPGPADGFAGMMRRTLRAWGMTGDALHEHLVSRLGDDAQGDDARALTGWLGEDLGDDTERYPPPDLAQRRALVTRLLHAFTRERPALVWIDDAHWSHDLLETLEHVLDHAPERAMLVVVTWRSDLVAADPALSAWLDRVCARPESERVDLGPLTASEEQALVQELLPVDAALAARVSSRAEGNPLFVRQILRWLIDDAEGIDGARARAVGGALPGTIRGIFERRVEDLLDDLGAAREAGAQALEVAAALGRRVDHVEWDAALEDAGVSAPAHLTDALVRRGLARQTPTGLEFEHALLVDALLERAARLDRLRRHHTHCARALASLSASLEARAREVDHWARAGSWARALEVSGQITRPIARSGNIRALRALLRRRLEWFDAAGTPADDGARLGTLLELGITHSSEGAADALAIAGEVLARARATGQPDLVMKSLELLAMIAEREGRFDHALSHARLAVEAARDLTQPRAEQIALVRLGWAHVHVGAPAEARAAFDATASAARAGGDAYLECYAQIGRIWVTLTRGALGDAWPLIDALVQTAHDHGWSLLETYGLCHRASAHVVSGDFDLAHAAARAATRASERAGTTAEEALLQSLEGLALVGLGRLDEASACAAASRAAGAPNQAAYATVLELAVAARAARELDFDAAAAWLMGEDAARAVIRPEHPAVATWAARQWRDRDPARASRALAVARALERRLDASPPQTP